MSTGGCGISLDRDSVSKEFQSRIVLGKKEYLYEVSAGTIPYPLLKMLQVRYRIIPAQPELGYGNSR